MKRVVGLLASLPLLLESASALEVDGYESQTAADRVYVSPTRLKQNPHTIPASVSRIERETIAQLPVVTIPDLLKFVAGMVVSQESGNQPRVNYHGTNGLDPRRMQVLVNGVSMYGGSYAEVNWNTLPISIGDIEFIEVTRSPSAAAYGGNAMMAVINIQTVSPLSASTLHATGSIGTQDYTGIEIAAGSQLSDTVAFRGSAAQEFDDGYDQNEAGSERRDYSDDVRFNMNVLVNPTQNSSANLFFGFSDTYLGLETRDSGQISYPDYRLQTGFLSADLRHTFSAQHDLRIKTYISHAEQSMDWQTCYPALMFSEALGALYLMDPGYASALLNGEIPTGSSAAADALRDQVLVQLATAGAEAATPVCGKVNENGSEATLDIELEDTLILSEALRLVSGFGVSRQTFDVETFLKERFDNEIYRAFATAEYTQAALTWNLGALLEYQSMGYSEILVSPRIGVNWRLSNTLSARAVFSHAERSPDIIESAAEWSYEMTGMEPVNSVTGQTQGSFFITAIGNDDLGPETITAHELGLHYQSHRDWSGSSLQQIVDVKLFRNNLDDLISEKLEYSIFAPTNSGEVRLTGVEFEYGSTFNFHSGSRSLQRLQGHINYAYIESDTNAYYEESLYARHVGGAYLIAEFIKDWTATLSYTGHSDIYGETEDIWGMNIARHLTVADNARLTLATRIQYEPDLRHQFTTDVDETVSSVNEKKYHIQLRATMELP